MGSLALSITACAGLLAWLEPAGIDERAVSAQDAERLALEAVEARSADVGHNWRQIEITSLGSSGMTTMLASAVPDPCDFVVTGRGRIRCTRQWRQPTTSSAGVVTIGLAGMDDRRDISLPQWVGLRALLLRLRMSLPPDTGPPPSIRLGSALVEGAPYLGGLLREMAASTRHRG